MVQVNELMRGLKQGPKDPSGLPVALRTLDKDLMNAVVQDMRALLGAVLSTLGCARVKSAHDYRDLQLLTSWGWITVRRAYHKKERQPPALLAAMGVEGKATPAAREHVVGCASLCGSFAEGRRLLADLTGILLSISKMRRMTLEYGELCLQTQEQAPPDVRPLPQKPPPKGEQPVPHTMFCMLDGTGVPCTKKDTALAKGKNGQAGTRQIRIGLFGEYSWLDKKGRPVADPNSFSYCVSGADIFEVSQLVRKQGMARGCASVKRMQCVADGEEALENAFRDIFPHAVFTNDFFHACEHLHACCLNLGLSTPDANKEYRFLKGLLYRSGAASVIKRLERIYLQHLKDHPLADKELEYLRKRQHNMAYGQLRKNGFFIASGHVEAGARVIIVRRCKQAGMHWRHKNAIRITAIIARSRSQRPLHPTK